MANSGRKRREDKDREHGGSISRRTGNRSGRQKAGMGSSSSGVGSTAGTSSASSSPATREAAGTDGDTGGGENVRSKYTVLKRLINTVTMLESYSCYVLLLFACKCMCVSVVLFYL